MVHQQHEESTFCTPRPEDKTKLASQVDTFSFSSSLHAMEDNLRGGEADAMGQRAYPATTNGDIHSGVHYGYAGTTFSRGWWAAMHPKCR